MTYCYERTLEKCLALTLRRALTEADHLSLTWFILVLIALSLGLPTQIVCFSTDETNLPSLLVVTISFVTGRGMMLLRR